MQEQVEVNGIVIASSPVGEADRRVVLLTKELGRITAFARNARRMNSSLVGVTRTFCSGRFFLVPGRDAYTLTKAEIREYFEDLVTDVSGTAYGCYFGELALFFSRENLAETDTLNLLYYSLKALLRKGIPNPLVRRIFELRLLSINGLLPDLAVCASCKKKLSEGYFYPALLQTVCEDCKGDRSLTFFPESALYTISFIREAPVQKLFSFNVSEENLRLLSEAADVFLTRFVDREMKSGSLLEVLG